MIHSPDELRSMAAYLVERARVLSGEGKQVEAVLLLAEAHVLRDRADAGERATRTHLHSSGKVGTVTRVETPASVSRGAAISAAKTKANTRWQQRLREHGLSIPEWVDGQPKKTPVSVEQARSWVKPRGKGGRAIPDAWARRLVVQFEDPDLALPESWPCGIR